MKKIILLLATILLVLPLAAYSDPGHGGWNGMGNGFSHGNSHGHGNFTNAFSTSEPPGLSRSGHMSYGLAKKHKRPAGWDRGRKEGWETTPISNIFGR